MRTRLLVSLLLLVATMACAESIVIKQRGSNETVIELSVRPVITFEGENMVVTSEVTNISLPLSDVEEYQMSDETPTALREQTVNARICNGRITLSGQVIDSKATVYSIEGIVCGEYVTNEAGIIVIDFSSLPKGICVISTRNTSIKVVNK